MIKLSSCSNERHYLQLKIKKNRNDFSLANEGWSVKQYSYHQRENWDKLRSRGLLRHNCLLFQARLFSLLIEDCFSIDDLRGIIWRLELKSETEWHQPLPKQDALVSSVPNPTEHPTLADDPQATPTHQSGHVRAEFKLHQHERTTVFFQTKSDAVSLRSSH